MRITPFDTDEEAVALANTVTCPTGAYVWTADRQRAHRLAPAIESAVTWVNSHNPGDRPTAGQADIDFYAQSRTVLSAADDTPVPRFGAGKAPAPDSTV